MYFANTCKGLGDLVWHAYIWLQSFGLPVEGVDYFAFFAKRHKKLLLIFLFVNLMLEFLSLSEILARVIRAPHCGACTLMECRTQIKHCGHSHTILELQLNIWSSSFLKRKSGSSAS